MYKETASEHRTESWGNGVLGISHHKQGTEKTPTVLTKKEPNSPFCVPTLPSVTSRVSKARQFTEHRKC